MSPREIVDATVAAAPVVVFSKSYCPFCVKAKKALVAAGIKPVVIELDEREDGGAIQQALAEQTGQRTVPSVFLNGEHIGGCDDTLAAVKKGTFKSVNGDEQVAQAEKAGYPQGKTNDGSAYIFA